MVFQITETQAQFNRDNADHSNLFTIFEAGWYWAYPEEPATGPFDSDTEAAEDAGLITNLEEQPEYDEAELEAAF